MSVWWTYDPQDLLMFSPETYYRLFAIHNEAIWPAHVLVCLAALGILGLMMRPTPWAGRAIAVLLAAIWALVAWGYFHERYATINLAASYYAWLFAAQSVLLLVSGLALDRLRLGTGASGSRTIGIALLVFGVVGYPLVSVLLGRPAGQAELFGFAPDPTVFATFGILTATSRACWELMVIPMLWCAITALTLWTMGSPEALLIFLAPILAVVAMISRKVAQNRERTHVDG